MDHAEVIRRCRTIVEAAGLTDEQHLGPANFLDYSNLVRDIIGNWSHDQRNQDWVQSFAEGLRRLRGDFLKIVEADPPVIYKPLHQASLEFHQSLAKTRYYRAGNRSSKTQSSVIDDYWVLTGQHPWRPRPSLPSSVGIVMVEFTKSAQTIFVPKFIDGEPSNPLSPIFPDRGKWLHHWDERKLIAHIACPECANAGRARSCRHPKSKLYMFSNVSKPISMAGGQHSQMHLSEQIPEGFYTEGMQRLKTVVHSGMIVEETPLGGKGFWTHKVLTVLAKSQKVNARTGYPLVTLHTVSQYETGLYPREDIDAECEHMSAEEIESRVYGRPAAFSATAVFDKWQISDMIAKARPPLYRCRLRVRHLYPEKTTPDDEEENNHWDEDADGYNVREVLERATDITEVAPVMCDDGELRVWESPIPFAQYVIGADVAEGLTTNDASCAQVLKMKRQGHSMKLEHVASYHDWVNSIPYAFILYRLALWYNHATIVPERRGPGDATCQTLRDIGCWMLHRDLNDPAAALAGVDARFGVDTNVATKPLHISALQNMIWNKRLKRRHFNTHDIETLEELGSYGQERSPSGITVRFRGEGGTLDDRVMGVAIATNIALTGFIYDTGLDIDAQREKTMESSEMTEHDKRLWRVLREEEQAEQAAIVEMDLHD